MKRHALVVALACAFTAVAAAQQPAMQPPGNPSKAAGTVLKNKAPVTKEILKVSLPKSQEADLANGVHLIVIEDHRAPQVFFQMIVDGAGGYYDPPSIPGLASFTASLMREGTATRTSEQISEQLDRLAAVVGVNAGLSSATATVSGSGLTNNLDTVLALMADVLMNPSFTQAEIDRYRKRTLAGLMNNRAQPGFLAQERLSKALFGDHPLSRISPTPAALDALTRDALVEFHKAHFVPDRAVLAVAGDISLDQAKSKAEAAFGAWKKSGATISAQTSPSAPARATISFVARPSSVQTSLRAVRAESRNPEKGTIDKAKIEIVMQDRGYEVKGHSVPDSLTAIVLRNQDTETHGFSSPLFKDLVIRTEGDAIEVKKNGIRSYHLPAGKTATLYFSKASRVDPSTGIRETTQYPFRCDIHPDMKGEFLVVETRGEMGGG